MGVEDQAITNLRIHVRGNHLTLGEEVPRRFPRILAGENQPPLESSRSGRLELAAWLTGPDHPLTARVMVNRLWLWHFGDGLVGSPDNFGRLGETPVNPDLLDWLSRRFVASGWSIKAMQRLIMLSSTYQMSTRFDPRAAQVDPENRLHWRTSRRRLDAEAIRDAILAVSGELDATMGGTLLTEKNHAYVNSTTKTGGHGVRGQPPLGLFAGDPERPLRRLSGVRLRRSERVQRQTDPDDGRPSGLVHDERPGRPEGLGGDGGAPARLVPVSTTRAGSAMHTWPPTAGPRPTKRSPAPATISGGSRLILESQGVAPRGASVAGLASALPGDHRRQRVHLPQLTSVAGMISP